MKVLFAGTKEEGGVAQWLIWLQDGSEKWQGVANPDHVGDADPFEVCNWVVSNTTFVRKLLGKTNLTSTWQPSISLL